MQSPQEVQSLISQHESEAAKLEGDLAVKRAIIAALRQVVGSQAPSPVQSKRPAIAIRELLAQHPDGVSSKVIADTLEHVIETKSDQPRRIIQNTLNQMKDAGAVKLTKKGSEVIVRLGDK